MRKNLVWPLFLTVITGCVVVYTALLSLDLYRYVYFSQPVKVEQVQTWVKKEGANLFSIEVDYLYKVDGVKYRKHDILKNKKFKNSWIAGEKADKMKREPFSIWIHPKDPHRAVMEKIFPTKRLFSTALLLGIFLYYCLLSRFMFRRG